MSKESLIKGRRPRQAPDEHPAPDRQTLELLLASSTEMVALQDPGGRLLYVSPAAEAIFGIPTAELVGSTLEQLVADDDLSNYRTTVASLTAARETATCAYRARRHDGSACWLETTFRGVRDLTGTLREVHSATRDIDRFKRLEATIERVAQEWRATVDSARDIIMMIDRDGNIARVNRPTTLFLGRTYLELVARDAEAAVAHLIDGPDPLLLRRVRGRLRRDEREIYLEGPPEVWLQLTVDPIRDDVGSWNGAVCVLRDISERKRAGEQLQESLERLHSLAAHLQSVREETRSTIARRIHDQLGYALTVLKLDLASLHSELGEQSESAATRVASLVELIDQTIETVRGIATELRPVVLDDFGLAAAIEWQTEEFERHTGISVETDTEEIDLDRDRATAAFRILQEALTNVARHAHADRVEVTLRQSAGELALRISDNGRGFGPDRIETTESHGILDMKERALVLGGEIDIEGTPGTGTVVSLRIPASPEPVDR